jgi:hypothetical protein
MSDTINAKGLKSKEAAKWAIKKNFNIIQSKLPKKQSILALNYFNKV